VLLVALAALQVALVARDQVLVVHAAREGARQAALGVDDAAARAAAAGATTLEPGRLRLALDRPDGGRVVRARASYTSSTDVPLVGSLVGDVALAGTVTMRSER
jgi:hypothetical protein